MSGDQSYSGYPGQGYPGQGYPDQDNPYGHPVGSRPKNGLGLASLILGVVGLLACWLLGIGLLPGLVGLVLGIVALRRVRRGIATNRGVAITGVVLSVLAVIASAVFLALYIWVFGSGGQEYADCVAASDGSDAAVQQCTQQYSDDLMGRFSS